MRTLLILTLVIAALACAMVVLYCVGFLLSRYVKQFRYVAISIFAICLFLCFGFFDEIAEYLILLIFGAGVVAAVWKGFDRGEMFSSPELNDLGTVLGEEFGKLINGIRPNDD